MATVRRGRQPAYATKKDLAEHKKDVLRLVKRAVRGVKAWDRSQDRKLLSKRSRGSRRVRRA